MPTATEVLNEAWRIHQAGDLQRAQAIYEAVTQQAPNNANAWCYLGILHFDRNDYATSESCYRRAIELQEEFPIAWSNLGNTLSALGRHDEAIECCERSLQQQPGYATAMNNLGAIYVKLGEFGRAAEVFRKAIELQPDARDTHRNLAAALIRSGELDDAAAHSQQAVAMNPRDADAHKNLGILHLLNGEFEAGWREYEWRFDAGDAKLPPVTQPRWQGEPLEGKSILLAGEQGLGDILQFARYAKILKSIGAARVIVQCQAVLHPLLATLPGADGLIPLDVGVETDYYISMMSVPGVLGLNAAEDIPGECGYITALPDRAADWEAELATVCGEAYRVGIVWQGSPDHQADRQRSVTLSEFAPLAQTPGVQLVSLQKGRGLDQLNGVGWPTVAFESMDDETPFLDTAALIDCLDLVVTVDTSVAHLAGAMGADVWLALGVSPDWRWMLHRSDSPWYPSMQLFRQQSMGEWGDVFQGMADALRTRVSESGKGVCESVPIPGAPGELIDKLTILRIKQRHLAGPALENVNREYEFLLEARRRHVIERAPLAELEQKLQAVNESLWTIEDDIRECELQGDFGETFIKLARSVYRTNDERAAIKREINMLLGSRIVEEKAYKDYQ